MRFLPASASSKTRTIISGTDTSGLFLDRQEESKLPPGKISSLRVFNLVQFNDSILWAGTRKGSIFQINTHTLKVTSLPILPHTDLYITYIYPDSHQRIWIGTDNNGLYVSDRNGSIIAFYSKEQLGSNAIKGIIEDEMSNVWVGTGNGLCCINSQTGSIDRYTTVRRIAHQPVQLLLRLQEARRRIVFRNYQRYDFFLPGTGTLRQSPFQHCTDCHLEQQRIYVAQQ